MGMNSMVGVCQQQKNNANPNTVTITSATFQTISYGTTRSAGPTAIDPSQAITTVLDSSNSFTVPTDGLAQYYSGSNTSQQVFHSLTVGYSASFTESSLPTGSLLDIVQTGPIDQTARTGDARNGSTPNQLATATSGSGDIGSALFTITGNGSVVTQITVQNLGNTGFVVGDTITFDGASAGGTSGGTFFYTLSENDVQGGCQVVFETTMANTPANSGLSTWPLEGLVEGAFLPSNSKETGVIITTFPSLLRSQVFPNTPTVGVTNVDYQGGLEVKSLGGTDTNNTERNFNLVFAAQNLGTSSSFDLVVKVLLADGSTVSSPAQTITIPAGAVKTNLVAGLGVNSYTTSTAAYGVQLGVNVSPIDPSQVLVSALDSGNSFTTPALDVGVGMAQAFTDPPIDPLQQVLHSYILNLDTSGLILSDYPPASLIVEYVFSWDADATNISADDGIVWDAETGLPSTVSGPVGSIFTQTIQVELDSTDTNTLIPQASVNFPVVGSVDTDYGGAWKAYSPAVGAPVVAPYTVNLQVRIQKLDGTFSESPVLTLNITDEGVAPTMN